MFVIISSAARSTPSGWMAAAAAAPSTAPSVRRPAGEAAADKGGRRNKSQPSAKDSNFHMSRRRRVIHKEEKIDTRYGSPVVARLITTVMKSGKKSLAERIVYTCDREDPPGYRCGRSARGAEQGDGEREASPRGESPPRRWRHLPGADGSAACPPGRARDALDRRVTPTARKNIPMCRRSGARAEGRCRWPGERRQEARRHPQDGAGEPRLRSLPLLVRGISPPCPCLPTARKTCNDESQFAEPRSIRSSGRATSGLPRTSMPARRRYRAHPFLHRHDPQDR